MYRRTKPPESYPAGGFLSEEFSCIVCNPYKAQHYRHFYQNTYHCCKCSSGLNTEQRYGDSNGKFKEITCANHTCRSSYVMWQS